MKKGTPKKRSEDMEEGEIMKETQLSIKNLHKSYDGHEILKGINLDVHRGEVVVILGPSGCGKSTLLRCINGLESIQDGSIALDREIISGRSASELSVEVPITSTYAESLKNSTVKVSPKFNSISNPLNSARCLFGVTPAFLK